MSIPLAFPAGSEAGDTQRFTVEIIDDAIVEGSELFSLVITDSSLTAQPVSGQDSASIAIIDNDAGKLACIYIPLYGFVHENSLLHLFLLDFMCLYTHTWKLRHLYILSLEL